MKRKSEKEIMAAIYPEDIFTMDIELIEQEKENYIMDFKPKDYCAIKNYTITRKVLLLYNQAIERLEGNVGFEKADTYKTMSPLFEVTTKGELYQFYENVFEGEVAYIYKGTTGKDSVYLKVAIDSDDNKLIDTEYEVLSELKHQSLPYAKQKIMINDNRAILMREIKGVTMSELLEQYPKGVPQEHVMWIMERLFSVVGYLHSKCVVHGIIKPENIIINKDNHNVSLVGFSFCIPKANTEDAKYKIVNEYYTAPEVNKTSRVLPSSDVYSIGKIAIKLLGGDIKTNQMPVSIDERVRKFIEKMVSNAPSDRPDDVWKLWSELIELRTEVFGTQRFKKLD